MQTLDDIIAEAKEKWIAPDGLMRLDLEQDFMPPYPGQSLDTVYNENGILFLAYFCLTLIDKGVDPKTVFTREHIEAVIARLEEEPGLLNRHPGNNKRNEAHDNYVGAIVLTFVFDLPEKRYAIYDYGKRNGFIYINVDPGSFSYRHIRQPGEISYYTISVGYVPHLLNWVWLLGGLLVASLNPKTGAGRTLLSHARIFCLDQVFKIYFSKSNYLSISYALVRAVFNLRLSKLGGIDEMRKQYFTRPAHPIRKLIN
jgi:hypothetical protein